MEKFRGNSTWLKNGNDMKLRRLFIVNRGTGGGGFVPSVTEFTSANVLPTIFFGVPCRHFVERLIA